MRGAHIAAEELHHQRVSRADHSDHGEHEEAADAEDDDHRQQDRVGFAGRDGGHKAKDGNAGEQDGQNYRQSGRSGAGAPGGFFGEVDGRACVPHWVGGVLKVNARGHVMPFLRAE